MPQTMHDLMADTEANTRNMAYSQQVMTRQMSALLAINAEQLAV